MAPAAVFPDVAEALAPVEGVVPLVVEGQTGGR